MPKKLSLSFVVKTFVCGVAFILAALYFSSLCAEIAGDYSVLFTDGVFIILLKLAVAALIFLLMMSVVAALVRPIWIAMIVFVVAAFMYPLSVGFYGVTFIAALIELILTILYLLFASYQFKNQIKFSTHPLFGKKLLMSTLLAVLVAVSVVVGYDADSATKDYVIPPVAKTFYIEQMTTIFKNVIESQKGTDEQKGAALNEAVKGVSDAYDNAENELKSGKYYVGILLGILAFVVMQTAFILVAVLALLIVPPFFWILGIIRFTHVVTEKVEVSRVTL